MMRRIFVFFLLTALLNSLVACGGKKWISAEQAGREQEQRQHNAYIIAVQTLSTKVSFHPPGASYDRQERLLAGRTIDGDAIRIPVDSIEKVNVRSAEADSMSEPHALSKSMFTSRLKHTSVEPMFAARLIADTTSTVTFAPQYGRLWLFDSTLTGQTINGDDFKSPLNQVSSVKVSRFSTGKTLLFAGGLLAVTAGIIGIIWASQDGFFQSGP